MIVAETENKQDEFEGRPDLVKLRARSELLRRVLIVIAGLYIGISLTIVTNNALVSIETRAKLLDCTMPTGDCYKEGEERTGVAIQQLIDANELDEVATRQIVLAAVVCARAIDASVLTEAEAFTEVQNCVDEAIKASNQS